MLSRFFRRPPPPGVLAVRGLAEASHTAGQADGSTIFNSPTGLYAFWYVRLRCEEEVCRAERNGDHISCISLQAPEALVGRAATYLKHALRDRDLAGYLAAGHFVVLLLDTDRDGATTVLERVRGIVGRGLTGGVASFPSDGSTFDALFESAATRAGASSAWSGRVA